MKLICITIILILHVAFEVNCQDLSTVFENAVQNSENMTALQKWQYIEKTLKKASGALVKTALPYIIKASEGMNISSQCMQEGMKLALGLKDIKPWALRFLDSSAKMVDGLLVGSLSSLGVYDECLNTEVKTEKGKEKGKVLFRGKYCTIDIKLPLPPKAKFYKMGEVIKELKNLTLSGTVMSEAVKYASYFYFVSAKMGVCVPSGCSINDIDQVVQKLGAYLMLEVKTYGCEIKEEIHFTPGNIGVMFVYCFFGGLMLIGSLTELFSYYKDVAFKGTPARFFLSFSFISNYKKLVNTNTSLDSLRCLHGFRFLSMSWVVIGHTYYFLNLQAVQNTAKGLLWGETFAFQVVLSGALAVDSFFFMGGFLACYSIVKSVKIDGQPLNVVKCIVHRLWRIYPAYIMVLIIVFYQYILSSGPLMHSFSYPYIDNCYKNWWANLLFIHNFYDVDKMCMAHTWYIAADIQLFIAALLILLPLLRWPKAGLVLTALAIIASILFTGIQTYVKDLNPTFLMTHPDPEQAIDFWKALYFTPFPYVAPYSIGLLAGYFLAIKPNFKMSQTVQFFGWIGAFICCFSTVYGVYNWNSGKEIHIVTGLMYATFHRTAWTLGVAWMIVCCATGRGGVINYILSWRVFIPLGRLSFIAYLMHPLVQIGFMANLRHIFVPNQYFIVWIFIGDICVSCAIAFVGYMLVEAPMISLENLIFRRVDKKNPSLNKKNGFLNDTIKAEKIGGIAVIVDKESQKTIEIDNPTFTKL